MRVPSWVGWIVARELVRLSSWCRWGDWYLTRALHWWTANALSYPKEDLPFPRPETYQEIRKRME